MSSKQSILKLALIQMSVSGNKADNVKRACSMVKKAASKGARLVALPECFNSPYGTQYFPEYKESVPGPTTKSLAEIAKECNVYLIGGSIPESKGDVIYNTCSVFSPEGKMIGQYRKMHLFDINVPGKISFKESDVLTGGKELLTFMIDSCKIGVGICYDIRFAELAQIYAQEGCDLLVYPGAFNMTTGPAHWELLQKARAIDNQVYVAAVSPARDESATYVAWGHSSVVGPWGDVIATTEEKENIVYADLDLKRADEIRENIPIGKQRRTDVYTRAKLNNINNSSSSSSDGDGRAFTDNKHVD